MKKISEKLWQFSAEFDSEIPQDATVVFWLCGRAPRRSLALSKDRVLVDYEIPDDPNGLDAAVFDDLVDLARMYKDCGCMTVCQMGENRSGLMSTLILIARGVETEEAIKTVQDNGNMNSVQSQAKGHSFWNPGFAAQVRRAFGTREA